MTATIRNILLIILPLFVVVCGRSVDNTLISISPMLRLTIVPDDASSPSVAMGSTLQFRAYAVDNSNNVTDVTGAVIWNTSDASIASVTDDGLVTGINSGVAIISASNTSLLVATTLTVTSIP